MKYGFDAFAIDRVGKRAECRCGATTANRKIWKTPPSDLHNINTNDYARTDAEIAELMKKKGTKSCDLTAFIINTRYHDGGVPELHSAFKTVVEEYMETIETCQKVLLTERELETRNNQTANGSKLLQVDRSKTNFAWIKWDDRTNIVSPNSNFIDYVRIQYLFAANMDDTRKSAFREAVTRWEEFTCVRFMENTVDTVVRSKGFVEVQATAENKCEASLGKGFGLNDPQGQTSFVTMGFCRDHGRIGAITHELGHVLGMYHTQMRKDALQSYDFSAVHWENISHGPFVAVNWDIIGNYAAQFASNDLAYMGSGDDGVGDPVTGYQEYDYASIMHYDEYSIVADASLIGQSPKTIWALQPGIDLGNWDRPSPGDLRQINDHYQCVGKDKVCGMFGIVQTTGKCRIDTTTCCVQTPINYVTGDHCQINFGDSPGPLNYAQGHFNLDASDTFSLEGYNLAATSYAGTTGPQSVTPVQGIISWTAGSNWAPGKGFQLCLKESCSPKTCDVYKGPANCGFQTDTMCKGAFVHDHLDNADWVRHSGPTSTPRTGPTMDADGDGYYMFVEATGLTHTTSPSNLGDKANLVSAGFTLSRPEPRRLKFSFYHWAQPTGGLGSLAVLLRSGSTDTEIWKTESGNHERFEWGVKLPGQFSVEQKWVEIELQLTDVNLLKVYGNDAAIPTGTIMIVFQAVAGYTDISDVAIDKVTFLDPMQPPSAPLPSTSLPPTTQAPPPCFTINARRHPTEYDQVIRTVETSPQDCQTRCSQTADCAFFSYWNDGGCHLSKAGATEAEEHGVISGPPSCSANAAAYARTGKICFNAPSDNVTCLHDTARWSSAAQTGTCVGRVDDCRSKTFLGLGLDFLKFGVDYQERMHTCCPQTCGVCGCGLSKSSCTDCDDNSDLCLKDQHPEWSGWSCAEAEKYCDHHTWGVDVLKCCPNICKASGNVAMTCNVNSDTCLQKQALWGGTSTCNSETSKHHCDAGTTPWYYSMWGINFQHDMLSCCPAACAAKGTDITWALCNHVLASNC